MNNKHKYGDEANHIINCMKPAEMENSKNDLQVEISNGYKYLIKLKKIQELLERQKDITDYQVAMMGMIRLTKEDLINKLLKLIENQED